MVSMLSGALPLLGIKKKMLIWNPRTLRYIYISLCSNFTYAKKHLSSHVIANWNSNFSLMFSDADDIALMLLLVMTSSEGCLLWRHLWLQLWKVFSFQAVEIPIFFMVCSHYVVFAWSIKERCFLSSSVIHITDTTSHYIGHAQALSVQMSQSPVHKLTPFQTLFFFLNGANSLPWIVEHMSLVSLNQ